MCAVQRTRKQCLSYLIACAHACLQKHHRGRCACMPIHMYSVHASHASLARPSEIQQCKTKKTTTPKKTVVLHAKSKDEAQTHTHTQTHTYTQYIPSPTKEDAPFQKQRVPVGAITCPSTSRPRTAPRRSTTPSLSTSRRRARTSRTDRRSSRSRGSRQTRRAVRTRRPARRRTQRGAAQGCGDAAAAACAAATRARARRGQTQTDWRLR